MNQGREDFTNYQIKKYLTYMVSFESVYNKYMDDEMPVSGSCMCPFHDNENTEAAKFYRESNTLWCFSETQLYTVYDLLVEFNLDPVDIFYSLWDSYSDDRKDFIKKQVDQPFTTKCMFKDSLISFEKDLISYDELCYDIFNSIDGLRDPLNVLYNISRPITEKNLDKVSDYVYLGAYPQNVHIRNITSGEIINYTKSLSKVMVSFIKEQNDVTIIFNMYKDQPIGATMRGNRKKEFRDIGNTGGIFYNLLNLKDFKRGDPIFLVEGPKDCEAFNVFFKGYHCLSLMTSNLTTAQQLVLRALTDKIVLCLDNDSVGIESTTKFIKKNSVYFDIRPITFPPGVKDFGDLITLYRKNKDSFKTVYKNIKSQLSRIDFV